MKYKRIQGSSLAETLVALSIIIFAVMGILMQQLQTVQSFHKSIDKEMVNSMLLNTVESYQLGFAISDIQYDYRKFHTVFTESSITITSITQLLEIVLVAPIYVKEPNADGL